MVTKNDESPRLEVPIYRKEEANRQRLQAGAAARDVLVAALCTRFHSTHIWAMSAGTYTPQTNPGETALLCWDGMTLH